MLNKNDIITLDIENCSLDGSGVGHHEGMAIFVPMAASGDKISARILKVKKGYAFAKIEEILAPSPSRIEPDCPVYSRCGGCAFRHISYAAELALKEDNVAQIMRRIGKVDIVPEPIIGAASPMRYRNKAQFPVSRSGEKINIGFYSPHSHRVADCRDCLLQPEIFEKILGIFEAFLTEFGISTYDEKSGEGLVRHIYIRAAQKTGEIMVCPVVNGHKLPHCARLIERLTAEIPQIKSIVLNCNTQATNVILGEKCVTLWGDDHITDELCGLRFEISAKSFYQVNRDGAELLYNKAVEYAGLKPDDTLLDLYCGTGTIGLSAAHKAGQVIGVEIIGDAVKNARRNAAANSIENARFICGDASQAAETLKEEGIKPNVVVLDPPRKGCAPELIETVAQMAPERVVYVSCDPATLARDCELFSRLGYKPTALTPVDMFPRTAHVECVCRLEKEQEA